MTSGIGSKVSQVRRWETGGLQKTKNGHREKVDKYMQRKLQT